jgi:hypothetical protein
MGVKVLNRRCKYHSAPSQWTNQIASSPYDAPTNENGSSEIEVLAEYQLN